MESLYNVPSKATVELGTTRGMATPDLIKPQQTNVMNYNQWQAGAELELRFYPLADASRLYVIQHQGSLPTLWEGNGLDRSHPVLRWSGYHLARGRQHLSEHGVGLAADELRRNFCMCRFADARPPDSHDGQFVVLGGTHCAIRPVKNARSVKERLRTPPFSHSPDADP